ncbi:hypothetical protein AAF712_013784 [Marasmius tenuissimus]|uniref:Uncharacterized protein n=1 Tax=Marasmius tenuissimus TaxID=585030 RepID=A0ABR2ZEV4_9AGAR
MSDSQSFPQSPSTQTFFARASSVSIGPHAKFIHVEGNQKTYQTFQQERERFESDEEVPEDAFHPFTGPEAQEIFERELRTILQPYVHPAYYDVSRCSCFTVDGQPSSGTPESNLVHTEGDGGINSNPGHRLSTISINRVGPYGGTFKKPKRRSVISSISQYKCDIRLLESTFHEKAWYQTAEGFYVLFDRDGDERRFVVGEIVAGIEKGRLVAFECFGASKPQGNGSVVSIAIRPASMSQEDGDYEGDNGNQWRESSGQWRDDIVQRWNDSDQRWDNEDQGRGDHSKDGQPRPADGMVSVVTLALNTPAGMLMSDILSTGTEVREARLHSNWSRVGALTFSLFVDPDY